MEQSLVLYDDRNNEMSLKIDEIKKNIAPTATEQEFWLFINTAKALNLNPIKREIYFVKFGDRANIVTGYQVYLERALKSKLVEYWNVEVEKPDPKDRSTWVGIFTGKRTDWTKEFVWHVPMVEVDKKQSTWNLMPEFLLKKNTLSQGIRMMIPEILSGMPYTIEEVTSGTSESLSDIPDAIKEAVVVVPSPEEQKAKDDAIRAELQKIMDKINTFDTVEKLDKWLASQKKLDESVMRDQILNMVKDKRHDLKIDKLVEVSGFTKMELFKYVNNDMLDSAFMDEVMAGNEEAIAKFAQDIASLINNPDPDLDGLGNGEDELV